MHADQVYLGGKIYTVDHNFSIVEAMAIRDGKIIAIGSDLEVSQIEGKEVIHLEGKVVYPGFIDPHAHLHRYAQSLGEADLRGTTSWEAVLDRMEQHADRFPEGWLIGRGWDQNLWPEKKFPHHQNLSEKFPDRPVYLERVDIHTALVNEYAFHLTGYDIHQVIHGGEIHFENGTPTGILVDKAMKPIQQAIPFPDDTTFYQQLLEAQAQLIASGLTSIGDALLTKEEWKRLTHLQDQNLWKMGVYGMLPADEAHMEEFASKGPLVNDRIHIGAFKLFADGTFGSRSAWLFEAYSDRSDTKGISILEASFLKEVTETLAQTDWQLNIHAIGDAAIDQIMTAFERVLPEGNPRRWRIEHAQLLDDEMLKRLIQHAIIPSIQPLQATSDLPWLKARLGNRISITHPMRRFLDIAGAGCLPLSTDFPVERIFPLHTFYASVTRKDPLSGKGPFMQEEVLSRKDALRGLTIWPAYSQHEEHEKGSLEIGKWADFVILDRDIMIIPESEIISTQILQTSIRGKIEYLMHND